MRERLLRRALATNSDQGELVGFVDTNVFVRFFVRGNPDFSERSRQLFEQIEAQKVRVLITDAVVFETIYALEKIYRVPREAIADVLVPLLALPGIETPNKVVLFESLARWSGKRALSFADCFHLVTAKAMGLDRKMSIPGVKRVEPPLA